MSTPKENAGCLKIVLVVVGIALGIRLLQLLYAACCYLGVNLFLSLDLSPYGQLGPGGWAGYALLGLGLGAAGGIMAAQRRFRLNKLVSIGAGTLALGLSSLLFIGNTANSAPISTTSTITQPGDETVSAPLEADTPPTTSTAIAPVAYDTQSHPDTASHPTDEWLRVVVSSAPLRTSWVDSLASPHTYLREEDSVHVVRRAHHWAQVVGNSSGLQDAPTGWIRLAGLGPLREPKSTPEEEISSPEGEGPRQTTVTPVVTVPTKSRASKKIEEPAPAKIASESAPNPMSWPVGHKQHTGQVGKLAATFSLDWQPSGVLSGRYYYDQNPGTIYRLTGAATPAGELRLVEFTRGKQSARCELQLQNGTYTGTMFNVDGREFPMTLEK